MSGGTPDTTRHCEPRWPRGNVASRGEDAVRNTHQPFCWSSTALRTFVGTCSKWDGSIE